MMNVKESQAAKEAAAAMESFINGASKDDMWAFAEEICVGMHRTLQQKFMNLTLIVIMKQAQKTDSFFDLRNEATVKLARKICEKFDKYDMALPLI